jgi:hypothetical protein
MRQVCFTNCSQISAGFTDVSNGGFKIINLKIQTSMSGYAFCDVRSNHVQSNDGIAAPERAPCARFASQNASR